MVTAGRLVRLVLVVYGVRFLLGPWPAAVVAAAACLWLGIRDKENGGVEDDEGEGKPTT